MVVAKDLASLTFMARLQFLLSCLFLFVLSSCLYLFTSLVKETGEGLVLSPKLDLAHLQPQFLPLTGSTLNSNLLHSIHVKEHSLLTPLVFKEIFSMLLSTYIMVDCKSSLVTFPPDFSKEVGLSIILRLSRDGKSPV